MYWNRRKFSHLKFPNRKKRVTVWLYGCDWETKTKIPNRFMALVNIKRAILVERELERYFSQRKRNGCVMSCAQHSGFNRNAFFSKFFVKIYQTKQNDNVKEKKTNKKLRNRIIEIICAIYLRKLGVQSNYNWINSKHYGFLVLTTNCINTNDGSGVTPNRRRVRMLSTNSSTASCSEFQNVFFFSSKCVLNANSVTKKNIELGFGWGRVLGCETRNKGKPLNQFILTDSFIVYRMRITQKKPFYLNELSHLVAATLRVVYF